MDKLPIQFVTQQIYDRGTSTPCVARTGLQTAELTQALGVAEDKRDRLMKIAMRVMEHLVACLEILERVRHQVEEGREELRTSGLQTQAADRVARLPRVVNLQKEAESFLYNAKLALRDTGGLFDVFHGEAFGHRYDKALKWARKALADESGVTELLEEDAEWIARVIDLRNAVEHPDSPRGPLKTQNFALAQVDGQAQVVEPLWWIKENPAAPICQEMETIHHNLLTFYEELQVLLLMADLKTPLPITVCEVPEEQRDPRNPIRFRVVWLGGIPCGSEEPGSE